MGVEFPSENLDSSLRSPHLSADISTAKADNVHFAFPHQTVTDREDLLLSTTTKVPDSSINTVFLERRPSVTQLWLEADQYSPPRMTDEQYVSGNIVLHGEEKAVLYEETLSTSEARGGTLTAEKIMILEGRDGLYGIEYSDEINPDVTIVFVQMTRYPGEEGVAFSYYLPTEAQRSFYDLKPHPGITGFFALKRALENGKVGKAAEEVTRNEDMPAAA